MKVEEIRSNSELIDFVDKGNTVDYLFFYGHSVAKNGSFSSTCFSQWYPIGFKLADIYYPTAEHYMMAQKARFFKDADSLEKILDSTSPKDAKKLGRGVKDFDKDEWIKHRFDYVVAGNSAKFGQNQELKSFLLETGNKVIVEASPRDRIWGIGMSQKNENAHDPTKWRGSNLLGYALMEVRQKYLK